jgi:hypothetical protein
MCRCGECFGCTAPVETPFEAGKPPYLVAMDLGGLRFTKPADTLDEAEAIVARMDDSRGYSSHGATIYQWRLRAVDQREYLHTIARFHFGERVA